MRVISKLVVLFHCLLTLCQTHTYRHPVRKRSDYNHFAVPSYEKFASRDSHPYDSFWGSYTPKRQHETLKRSSGESIWNSINHYYAGTPLNRYYPNSVFATSHSNPSYTLGNINNGSSHQSSSLSYKSKSRISKADAENDKFAGAGNQELDDEPRTIYLKRRKFYNRFGGGPFNPCSQYGRGIGNNNILPPKEQGRFLWDINIYKIYPQTPVGFGCGGFGGFGSGPGGIFGPGLLSDPIASSYYPTGTRIAQFLSLFAPGILQNSLAATAPTPQFSDYTQASNNNYLQNDPQVDPNYTPGPVSFPVRKPNSVFYDSVKAPAVTPSQLVGGISTTVNRIIQQLTGDAQPGYG